MPDPTRRPRTIPTEFVIPVEHYSRPFNVLGDVAIKTQAVVYTRCAEGATTPTYSDAELDQLIAEVEVARESLNDDLDRTRDMLVAIRNTPPPTIERSN